MGSAAQTGAGLEGELRRGLNQLAALCLLDSESYGYELARRMAERGVEIDEGTLYPMLRRLETRGLLRSRWDTDRERPRRYYVITDKGRQTRIGLLESWVRLRGGLDALGAVEEWWPAVFERASLDAERAALAAERQEIEMLRSDLLSTVSHELRTPLTLVRTSISLLLDGNPDEAMRDRLLRNIKQSADRMQVLVADILELVRLRGGRAELQVRYVDVGELIAGAVALMRPLLDQKRQSLETELASPVLRVMGDHRRLEQVLLNLLSNANKFAPTGARIGVAAAEEEQAVIVSVSDTGPGIPPEAQARLFEQFYTSRTSSPSHNIGAGLGLPIAKGIVEAHGGRIWVESQAGVGATFHISLPKDGPGKGDAGENPGGG